MKTGTIQIYMNGSAATINAADLPAWESQGWTREALQAPQEVQKAQENVQAEARAPEVVKKATRSRKKA